MSEYAERGMQREHTIAAHEAVSFCMEGGKAMGLVLSREEVRGLTGSRQRAKQREHLNAMGIPYRVNAHGWPIVLTVAVVKALGGEAANDEQAEATLNMEFLE